MIPITTPIIMPVQHKVDCILVEGVKYCEQLVETPEELGLLFLAFVGILLYIVILGNLTIKFDHFGIILVGIIAPFLIAGLILIN